jgi:hypothetical protein
MFPQIMSDKHGAAMVVPDRFAAVRPQKIRVPILKFLLTRWKRRR